MILQSLRQAIESQEHRERRRRMRRLFSPSLSYGRHGGPPHPRTKQAAVMILLEKREGTYQIPLTVRPNHLPDHPGQISFPGGRLEGTEGYAEAAVREFGEELGVTPFPGQIVGELDPIFVYNSDYFVRPFVAVCSEQLHYAPCPHEVDRVIHLPVENLLNEASYVERPFSRGSVGWKAKTIRLNEDYIWGATAIMLGELSAVLHDLELTD